MDKYDCSSWIEGVKDLVTSEQVELTGSAAYHSLLTKVSHIVSEKQIVLNEYGLGYYFGRRSGFEGEPSVLVKDLNGFFPPELAINNETVKLIDTMGYKWIMVDELALSESTKDTYYTFEGTNTSIISRDNILSNMISFKRDSNFYDVWAYMQNSGKTNFVIVLDGETFGHHYADGINWLDLFVDFLIEHGVKFETVSNIIETMDESSVSSILENSWGASREEFSAGNLYPMWEDSTNPIHVAQWKVLSSLDDLVASTYLSFPATENTYESLPFWKLGESDDPVLLGVKNDLQLQKLFNSDQFWWASKKTMPKGEYLFDKGILLSIVNEYKNILNRLGPEYDSKKISKVQKELDTLEALLTKE